MWKEEDGVRVYIYSFEKLQLTVNMEASAIRVFSR